DKYGPVETFNSSAYFGYMVIKGLELGIRPGITTSSYNKSTSTSLDLYFNPNYNFNSSSNVCPYLGFIVGYNSLNYGSGDNYHGLSIGGEGGLKILLSASTLLLLKVEYIEQNYKDVNIF